MQNASGDGSVESTCSTLKISETILKTGQLDRMKPWYVTFLGVQPFFEHAPPPGNKPGDFGGQTRASDLSMCFFRLSIEYPFVQTIGIFEEPGTATEAIKGAPGLHHMQVMTANLDMFVAKVEALRDAGMHPHRSADHGPMTSFYYRDPDGNNVELTVQNFPTMDAMVEFMRSDVFKANPSGREIDPEAFIADFRRDVAAREPAEIG